MIRPFLALFTFFVLTFGAAAGSHAAEPLSPVLAQIQHMTRGTGLYLNLFKFVPVVLIYLLWARTTDWVEHDTKELNNLKFGIWNSVIFFSGALGLVLGPGDPDLFPGAGALAPGVLRPLADVRLCPKPDGPRRPEGADALPFRRTGQRPAVQAGHEAAL